MKRITQALMVFFCVMAGTPAMAAYAWQDTHVLELRGHQLPMALGVAHGRLSVLRWEEKSSAFVPVPFQIDTYGEADLVWFASTGLRREADAELMAHEDMLLMKANDGGGQAPASAQLKEGKLLGEIKLQHKNDTYYFYLAKDSPLRSDKTYVQHDVDKGITRTASYALRVDPDNELNWRYLTHKAYEGEGSIIDTLKMRMSAGFMSRRARVTLDNNNLRPKVTGVKVGPIRSVMHLETRVVITGISVMKLQLQALRYPDHYEAHSHAVIPSLYKAMLKQPEVTVTIDGNEQYGAQVQTAQGEGLVATVTGEPSEAEATLVEKGLSAENSWILFDSRKNFSLLAYLDLPENLKDTPLGLVFVDDKAAVDTPEQYPGQLPNLGYALKGWPPEKELRFSVKMFFDEALHTKDVGAYAQHRTQAPKVSVSAWPHDEA